nr:hypothetical protein [Dialister invisus]
MAKYIDADALKECLKSTWDYDDAERIVTESEIDNLPAADVAEVVHGQWILEREPDGKPYCFHCSVCDNDFHYIGIFTAYDYCPNCGAKMDGMDGEKE